MAEIEKIELKFVVNGVDTSIKNLGELETHLKQLKKDIKGVDVGSDAFNKMQAEISDASKKLKELNVVKPIQGVTLSLGEMRRELRELRNISFGNLTPEEVTNIKSRMAELTDEIGDFQAQVKQASSDRIPALMDGLQGLVSIAQLGTATFAMFGFENEKLEKTMVQLIGVSQALSSIQELQEKGTLKIAAATLKDTLAKIANAIAAKGQAMATEEATVATTALGKAMMANPYLVMAAAAAALVTGLIVLTSYLKEQGSIQKEINEANEAAAKDIGKQKQDLNSLLIIAKDHSKSLKDRQDAMNKINELSPEYLGNLTLETINTSSAAAAINLYTQEISKKAKAKALESILTEKYIKLEEQYASGAQIQHISDTKDEIAALERKLADLTTTTAVFTNVTSGAQSNLTDLIGTSQIGVPEGTKAVNYDGTPIEYKGGKWVAVVVTSPTTGGKTKAEKEKETNDILLDLEEKYFENSLQLLKNYSNEYITEQNKLNKEILDNRTSFEKQVDDELNKIEKDRIDEEQRRLITRNKYGLDEDTKTYEQELRLLEYYGKLYNWTEEEILKASQNLKEEYKKTGKEQIGSFLADSLGVSEGDAQQIIDKGVETAQMLYNSIKQIREQNMQEEMAELDALYQKKLKNAEGNEQQTNQIEKAYAIRKAKLEEEQRKKRKKQAIADAIINGAVGATAVWTMVPPNPVLSGILSAMIAVQTAAQVAVIASQKFAKGGVLKGKSHADGGILTPYGELEGGEGIINKKSMSNPSLAAIASYANVAGGGVPLTSNTPAAIIDYKLLAAELGAVINNKEVILVASKVTKQQETDAKVMARAKI